MANGYFNDGTVNIELGAHVFATPSAYRRIVILSPADLPAQVLDSGGGMLELQVLGQRLRDNLGDAERYIYEHFHSLATSDPGTLGCQDNLANRATFGQSVCMSATGEVKALKFAELRFEFLTPEKSAEPAWGVAPAGPATYPGTSTLQDYATGGVTLGIGVSMRIEMMRQFPLREIPRARGSRARGPERNAQIRFIVLAHLVDRTQNLATALEILMRQIGPRPRDLTGNGNTFEDVVLESLRPAHTDMYHTSFEAEFVKEV